MTRGARPSPGAFRSFRTLCATLVLLVRWHASKRTSARRTSSLLACAGISIGHQQRRSRTNTIDVGLHHFSDLSKYVSQLPKFLIETTSKTSAVKRSSPAFPLVQKPHQRRGGECFGKAVVSFAPTSASGCTNEAFAANRAGGIIDDRSRQRSAISDRK